MGKKERQNAENNANTEITRNRQLQDSFIGGQQRELDQARTDSSRLRGNIESRFNEFSESGGMDPTQTGILRDRTSQLWQNGGYDNLSGLRSRLRETSTTGGFDPTQLEALRREGAARQDTGGFNPEMLGRLRTGYTGMIDNGGVTDDEANAFRRHATAGVGATYSSLRTELGRRSAITGGYAGGGETAAMARQAAQEAARAGTGAEVDLAAQRRTGRTAGLTGLSGLESNVAGGVRDVMQQRGELESAVATGRQRGLGMETQLETDVASNRRAAVQAQQDLEQGIASRRIQAAGGLTQLYQADPGYVNALTRSIVDAWSTGGKLNAEQTQILEQLSRQPGLFQNIMQGIATGAGVASLFVPGAPKPEGKKG